MVVQVEAVVVVLSYLRQLGCSRSVQLEEPTSGPVTLTITITDRTVTITDGADSGSAPLSADGKNFKVPVELDSDPSAVCDRPVIISGTIDGTSVSGMWSGTATCTNRTGTGSVRFGGTFSGTQTGTAKGSKGASMGELINSVIE